MGEEKEQERSKIKNGSIDMSMSWSDKSQVGKKER